MISLLGTAILATKRFQKQSSGNGEEQTPILVSAVHLLGAIPVLNKNLHLFFWVGWWRAVYEQTIAQVKGITADETWKKAFAEGSTLSMQKALAMAWKELQSTK